MQQRASDVDNKLIRNDQRNATQEGVITGLFPAMRKLTNQMEKDYQDKRLMSRKVTEVGKQMEGIGRVAREEFNKSMSSAAQVFEAMMKAKHKDRAIPSKSDVKAKLLPCLNFRTDGRKLGAGAKTEQPPATQAGQKMEIDSDSISSEKENRPNISKRNKRRNNVKQVTTIRMLGGAECSITIGSAQSDGGDLDQYHNQKEITQTGESHQRCGRTSELILEVRPLEISIGLWS